MASCDGAVANRILQANIRSEAEAIEAGAAKALELHKVDEVARAFSLIAEPGEPRPLRDARESFPWNKP